jgi:hypothetical protein
VLDWVVDLVTSFFDLLYSIMLRHGGVDKICWIPSKRRVFEVRSFNLVLFIPVISHFPWKSIWRGKVPSIGILSIDGGSWENLNFG